MSDASVSGESIGTNAGRIWGYLSRNGKSDLRKIRFGLKLNNAEMFLALGWLCREGKVVTTFDNDKNTYFAELK
ncbi:MAG: winged helix-turn-helix domain-containing protein [Elusimicrobiota bacterium]